MNIEEKLTRYNLDDNKFYRLTVLYQIFQQLGIINMKRSSFTSDWIRHKVQQGRLVLPPKQKEDLWKLSGKTIKDIVRAFVPGGPGHYDYEHSTLIS